MQTHETQLENLNKQLIIGTKINIIIQQSTKLLDIINDNQKEVNRLKAQSDKLTLTSSDDIKGGW